MNENGLSDDSFFNVVARYKQLGKCSRCTLYSKCKGIKLLCDNPNDNPKNPRKNPNNPIKEEIK